MSRNSRTGPSFIRRHSGPQRSPTANLSFASSASLKPGLSPAAKWLPPSSSAFITERVPDRHHGLLTQRRLRRLVDGVSSQRGVVHARCRRVGGTGCVVVYGN